MKILFYEDGSSDPVDPKKVLATHAVAYLNSNSDFALHKWEYISVNYINVLKEEIENLASGKWKFNRLEEHPITNDTLFTFDRVDLKAIKTCGDCPNLPDCWEQVDKSVADTTPACEEMEGVRVPE